MSKKTESKIVELKVTETKAVVGGNTTIPPAVRNTTVPPA